MEPKIKLVILSLILCKVLSSCNIGWYQASTGQCERCDEGCKACTATQPTVCTDCMDYMNFNETTGECTACPDQYYFDQTSLTCLQCNGSCRDKCAYREQCYQCATGELYDYETRRCVTECGENSFEDSYVFQNNSQVQVCKSLNYYVNPNSEKILELGTQEYPYKSLDLVFTEIYNKHSNTDRKINVYAMELLKHYLRVGYTKIINVTEVNIESYSEYYSESPSRAYFVVKSTAASLTTSTTFYNAIQNTTLKTLDSSSMETAEYGEISVLSSYVIVINRSNVRFNNLNLTCEISNPSVTLDFVYTVYCHTKTVAFTNSHFEMQGKVLQNNLASVDIFSENITLDMYKSTGGFLYNTACNYPEAQSLATHEFNNVYAYTSGSNFLLYGVIISTGSANVTLNNIVLEVYFNVQNLFGLVGSMSTSSCIPQDDVFQYYRIYNLLSTLSDNPDGDRAAITFFYYLNFGSTRYYSHEIHNGLFTDRVNDNLPILAIYGIGNEDLILDNITISYGTVSYHAVYIETIKNVYINDLHHEGLLNNASPLVNIDYGQNIEIVNMSFKNLTAVLSTILWVEIRGIEATANITNVTFESMTLYQSPALQFEGTFTSIVMSNVEAKHITIDSGTSVIKVNNQRSLTLSGLTMTNITGHSSNSIDNYMLDITNIDFSGTSPLSISDVTVSNSTIGFFKLTGLTGTPVNHSLTISNMVATDCAYTNSRDLVSIENVLYQTEFELVLVNHTFERISFEQGGNLYHFGQVMPSVIKASNFVFRDITGGQLLIEAFSTTTAETNTKIEFDSMKVNNVNAMFGSFLNLGTGAEIEISDSTFTNIFCYEEGSVIYAGPTGTTTQIMNSTFTNNTSLLGGAIYIESQSYVGCDDCTFYNNFGVEGGVVSAMYNGYFKFERSIFYNNYAVAGLIANIFDSTIESSIRNSTIYKNIFVNEETIQTEITGQCTDLCFFQEQFKDYIISDPSVLEVVESESAIKSIIGTLSLPTIVMYSQSLLIDGYSSMISLTDSSISNCTFVSSMLKFSVSSLTIINTNITNILNHSNSTSALISVITDSAIKLSSLSYTNSETSLLLLRNVTGSASSVAIRDTSSLSSMIQVDLCYTLDFKALSVQNSSSDTNILFSLKNSYDISVTNSVISSIPHPILYTLTSTLSISNLSAINTGRALHLIKSIVTILDSEFENMSTGTYGGAIYSSNGNITVVGTFKNCTGRYGGAITFLCSTSNSICKSEIVNSTFKSNTADVEGGAIYYNLYRPEMADNVFTNNQALYGNNIASYPVKAILKDQSWKLENIVSGQVLTSSLTFELVDHDGQVVNIDSSSQLKIIAIQNGTSVEGVVEASVTEGVATFDALKLVSPPGSKNIEFKVTAEAVDDEIIALQFENATLQNNLFADFRYCESGEIERNNKCEVCSPGTYSLGANKTNCLSCINDAVCLGGKQINVNSGFFRSSLESDHLTKCIREESCKGGYYEDQEYPVACKEGYTGILCAECVVEDGRKYEKNSSMRCSKCPDQVLNVIRIVGIMLAILAFLTALIIINIRKASESQQSTLMRIMTNYLQVISTALAFNASYPGIVSDLLMPAEAFGSSSESFVSLDCFVEGHDMNSFAPTPALFKLFLTSLLPIILIVMYTSIWIVLYFVANKWCSDIKRNIIVSAIVILFLLHPALTKASLNVFQCVEVDENDTRVLAALNIECYSSSHVKWMFTLGFPSLIIWGVGIPMGGLFLLINNRKKLDIWEVQKYMLMLYQGLKLDRYYWELVNTLRKILLLCTTVFLSTFPISYKILTATIIMLIILRIQVCLKPYKSKSNNQLEFAEIVTGTFTLFASMIFEEDEDMPEINLIVFIMMIAINVRFLIFWMYCMLNTIRDKYKLVNSVAQCIERVFKFTRDEKVQVLPRKLTKSLRTPKKKVVKKKVKRARRTKKDQNLDNNNSDIDFVVSRRDKKVKDEAKKALELVMPQSHQHVVLNEFKFSRTKPKNKTKKERMRHMSDIKDIVVYEEWKEDSSNSRSSRFFDSSSRQIVPHNRKDKDVLEKSPIRIHQVADPNSMSGKSFESLLFKPDIRENFKTSKWAHESSSS